MADEKISSRDVIKGRYRTWLRDQVAGNSQDADRTVAALYDAHYQPLVRLARLLVHDLSTAEEVVQDSFAALHARTHRLNDPDRALAYLRTSVVNRSRSAFRHQIIADKHAARTGLELPAAQPERLSLLERCAVISALRKLPARQREVVVLRFYAGLCEAQTAATLGVSRGAVRSHTAQAMSRLRAELDNIDE